MSRPRRSSAGPRRCGWANRQRLDLSTVTCGNGWPRTGRVTGGAIATSSLLYLVLPIIMGLLLRYTRLSLNWATLIFVPLVGVVIWIGQYMPFDVGLMVQHFRPGSLAARSGSHRAEDLGRAAAWLLPGRRRGAGVAVAATARPLGRRTSCMWRWRSARSACSSATSGFNTTRSKAGMQSAANGETFLPFLFITIACGACSGFHSLIASGTTSKQLRLETDAKPIGYGAMLLEAMVATFALACVMMLRAGQRAAQAGAEPDLRGRPGFVPGRAARAARRSPSRSG